MVTPTKPLSKEEALELYKKRSDEIIKKMYQILYRAHRKVDDGVYRKTLEKLQNIP